jgi:hypothetical protein
MPNLRSSPQMRARQVFVSGSGSMLAAAWQAWQAWQTWVERSAGKGQRKCDLIVTANGILVS